MNTVEKMRAALAGAITVRTWWGCPGLSGGAFRSWFLGCLMAKINRHDWRHGRRLTPDYQAGLYRDARRLREIQQRIIHRQFETDIFKRRFGHLLTHDRKETFYVRTYRHQSLPGRPPLSARHSRSTAQA